MMETNQYLRHKWYCLKNNRLANLEVGVPSARALRRSTAAVGLVEQEAEDVEQEHDGDDVQVGEQPLKQDGH